MTNIQDSTTTGFMQQYGRRNSNMLKAVYVMGTEMSLYVRDVLAPYMIAQGWITVDGNTGALVAVAEHADSVIDDGRSPQGVPQPTIAELVVFLNNGIGLISSISENVDYLASIMKMSDKPIDAS